MSLTARARRVATVSVNFDAFLHNLKRVKQLAPNSKIAAVIKANAYGHGMVTLAKKLVESSDNLLVDSFAVAMIGEAIALRKAGIKQPIMVFHGCMNAEDLSLMEQHNLQPIIHQLWQLDLLETQISKPLDVWLKVETGMHRLGLPSEEIGGVIQRLSECELVQTVRLMSHYANADEVNNIKNINQLNKLLKVNNGIKTELSMANSAAILSQVESHLNVVRPGIMLYGSSPLIDQTADDLDLKPVMQFESHVLAIHALKQGDHIGYGSTFTCPEAMKVAIVAVGYGDGYPRAAKTGTPVWLNGKRCDLLGRVSMDSICIDLRHVDAKPGDRVVLWGQELPVDEVASSANTIAYELFCQVGNTYGLN